MNARAATWIRVTDTFALYGLVYRPGDVTYVPSALARRMEQDGTAAPLVQRQRARREMPGGALG